jgi:hypothetical protein
MINANYILQFGKVFIPKKLKGKDNPDAILVEELRESYRTTGRANGTWVPLYQLLRKKLEGRFGHVVIKESSSGFLIAGEDHCLITKTRNRQDVTDIESLSNGPAVNKYVKDNNIPSI